MITLGKMFNDVLHLLEIGSCQPSKKMRSIVITPHYGGALQASPPKALLVIAIQVAFRKLRAENYRWDMELSEDAQLHIGEVLHASLLATQGVHDDNRDEAENDLVDALHGLYDFERARSKTSSPS